jgi:hypothetical protein
LEDDAMKIFASRVTWGFLLIFAGAIFLLQNFNLIPPSPSLWGTAAVIGGVFFLVGFLLNREYWWAAFPAFVLLGAALVTFWDLLPLREGTDALKSAAFLGMLGFSFIAVYLRAPRQWWAIIPAGALFSSASVMAFQTMRPDASLVELGGVFFIGLGVTFLLVFILPSGERRRGWALWPAMSLLLVGGLITAAAMDLLGLLWPVALILAGLLVLLRGFRR